MHSVLFSTEVKTIGCSEYSPTMATGRPTGVYLSEAPLLVGPSDWSGYAFEGVACVALATMVLARCPSYGYWAVLPLAHLLMTCGRAKMNSATRDGSWPKIVNELGSVLGIGAFGAALAAETVGPSVFPWSTVTLVCLLACVVIALILHRRLVDYSVLRRRRIMLMAPVAVWALFHSASIALSGPSPRWVMIGLVALQAAVLTVAFMARFGGRRQGATGFIGAWRYGIITVIALQIVLVTVR